MRAQSKRIDTVVTCVIVVVAAVAVLGAWLTAPVRHVELQTATEAFEPEAASAIVSANTASFRTGFSEENVANRVQPLVANGLLIVANPDGEGTKISALNPTNGDVVWSYARTDSPLCTAMHAWQTVTLVFQTERGCGDVITLEAATGEYSTTRSSNTSDAVLPVWSNDRVGIITDDRVELWRSDMVRTVEYGAVENPQEAESQPHADEHCTMQSALTRKEFLAVAEECNGETWLRLQQTTPEDSRVPELSAEVPLAEGSRVVAIGQTHAVVYSPTPTPQLITYNEEGVQTAQRNVEPAAFSDALGDASGAVFARDVSHEASDSAATSEQETEANVNAEGVGLAQPIVADLPHRITWFDGHRLYLFTPETMEVDEVLEDAIGTGIAVNNTLYYPTRSGINVADWSTGQVLQSLPVDREGYSGRVNLAQANGNIIESRGSTVAVLEAVT